MPTSVLTRTSDGRVPGPRARATRQNLVNATVAVLAENSYRTVTVGKIAHKAGTSPASFYQYFADIDEAVLAAVSPLVGETESVLSGLKNSSWVLDGVPSAARFVNSVLDVWDSHSPVMRILTIASAERNDRFVDAYTTVTSPVTRALTAAAKTSVRAATARKAMVHSLVLALASVAGHGGTTAVIGLTSKTRRDGLARIIHASLAHSND